MDGASSADPAARQVITIVTMAGRNRVAAPITNTTMAMSQSV